MQQQRQQVMPTFQPALNQAQARPPPPPPVPPTPPAPQVPSQLDQSGATTRDREAANSGTPTPLLAAERYQLA